MSQIRPGLTNYNHKELPTLKYNAQAISNARKNAKTTTMAANTGQDLYNNVKNTKGRMGENRSSSLAPVQKVIGQHETPRHASVSKPYTN